MYMTSLVYNKYTRQGLHCLLTLVKLTNYNMHGTGRFEWITKGVEVYVQVTQWRTETALRDTRQTEEM